MTKSSNIAFKFNLMDFKCDTLYIDEETGHICDSFARLSWGKTTVI